MLSKFGRDLRMHKLVFEKDGLPDGTQVGYYIHGKVIFIISYSYSFIFVFFFFYF